MAKVICCYFLLLLAACASAQESPCPKMFLYEYDGKSWIGVIRVPTSMFGTTIKMLLTMALEAPLPDTNNVGNIVLASNNQEEVVNQIMRGEIITYNVLFPIPSPIPKVTSLLINDQEFCRGPPVEASYNTPIVTTLQIKHDLSVTNRNEENKNPIQHPQNVLQPRPNPYDFLIPLTNRDTPYTDVPKKLVVSDEGCGLAGAITNSLIIRGEVTEPGDWPWLTALYETDKNSNLKFICSGSLISRNLVVTAAHCLAVGSRKKKDIIMKLGIYNVFNWTEPHQKIVHVKDSIIHSDYNTNVHHNDIALLKFDDVKFTRFIKPICLWRGDINIKNVVGVEGTVVGWGKDENVIVVPEPKKAKARIVSPDICKNEVPELIKFLTDKTLCAGNRDGSGPCNGDSGGGLYILRNKRWMLRGIVSNSLLGPNGEACSNLDYVVYTDSAKYLDWIESHMS